MHIVIRCCWLLFHFILLFYKSRDWLFLGLAIVCHSSLVISISVCITAPKVYSNQIDAEFNFGLASPMELWFRFFCFSYLWWDLLLIEHFVHQSVNFNHFTRLLLDGFAFIFSSVDLQSIKSLHQTSSNFFRQISLICISFHVFIRFASECIKSHTLSFAQRHRKHENLLNGVFLLSYKVKKKKTESRDRDKDTLLRENTTNEEISALYFLKEKVYNFPMFFRFNSTTLIHETYTKCLFVALQHIEKPTKKCCVYRFCACSLNFHTIHNNTGANIKIKNRRPQT